MRCLLSPGPRVVVLVSLLTFAGCSDSAEECAPTDCSCQPDADICVAARCQDGLQNGDETDIDCGGMCGACVDGQGCSVADDCTSMSCSGGVCAAPSCTDTVQNSDETDVDCGGSCPACATGLQCAINSDCELGICTEGVCQAATCVDGVQNGDESDTDCGGSCPTCADGLMCIDATSCTSGVCTGGVCIAPTCDDLVRNGDETDADCGGGTCGPCGDGLACTMGSDCLSEVCTATACAAPSCTDMVLNGDETDTDCGGSCDPCDDGAMCTMGPDCVSTVCLANVCSPANCTDGALNGDETDIDCGGACPGCGDGRMCNLPADCQSSVCSGGSCAIPACDDLVQNGDETDTDCGGSCNPCTDGSMCMLPADCVSGVCTVLGMGGVCAAPSCGDLVQNGTETDADCGGSCPACADGLMCAAPVDCQSSVCSGGSCAVPTCADATQNGTETDADCGGSCPACPDGSMCGTPADCQSSVCSGGSCAVPTCTDSTQNGDETDADCGGSCPACPDGDGCAVPADCQSGVCSGGSCAMPACDDLVQNGTESDVDCGGACAGCPGGSSCGGASDCLSTFCIASVCIVGPTSDFTVTPSSGAVVHSVSATSSASAGDTPIVSTEYNFGDGAGFETDTVHSYLSSGMFMVTQRVTDGNGLTDTSTRSVMVNPSTFTPVLLSTTDRSPSPEMELTADRTGMEVVTGFYASVRSDTAVMPGSGMFYFEGQRTTPLFGEISVGVATAAHPLGTIAGTNAESVAVETGGSIFYNGSFIDSFPRTENEYYGIVVDYRGVNPIVHVLIRAENPTTFAIEERVHATVTMTVTTPLYILIAGRRRAVGPQAFMNPGNDTTNFPFHYDPVALLNAASLAGSALTLGWGQTRALPANAPPVIMPSAPTSIALGASVTVTATAFDPEDGTVTDNIFWENLATPYGDRTTGAGGSFTLTPNALGIHPLRASVTDSGGETTQVVIDVSVTGTLPQFDPVRLVPDAMSGAGIVLSTDGLSAYFTAGDKYGIRANQGMMGEFQYFEMQRLVAPGNRGGGLVIQNGNLNPYAAPDVPPSCSVNQGVSIWRNIIYEEDYDPGGTNFVGFAVDYRGRHPIVYVITQTGGTPVLSHTMVLDDVTVPIYPMLYGNPTTLGPFDSRINFGATPFHYAPVTVLTGAGVDATGLEVGWGDANTP
ncbi:MAG: hypothetical protein AAGF12_14410 [Myxococcota bacterium]